MYKEFKNRTNLICDGRSQGAVNFWLGRGIRNFLDCGNALYLDLGDSYTVYHMSNFIQLYN